MARKRTEQASGLIVAAQPSPRTQCHFHAACNSHAVLKRIWPSVADLPVNLCQRCDIALHTKDAEAFCAANDLHTAAARIAYCRTLAKNMLGKRLPIKASRVPGEDDF